MDYTSGDGKAALTGYTSQDDNGGEPVALLGSQLACVADHDRHLRGWCDIYSNCVGYATGVSISL